MNDKINHLISLSEQLPEKIQSDWVGTNHFELTTVDEKADDFFCLDLKEAMRDQLFDNWFETPFGKKVGLLLDIAEALKESEPLLKKLNK